MGFGPVWEELKVALLCGNVLRKGNLFLRKAPSGLRVKKAIYPFDKISGSFKGLYKGLLLSLLIERKKISSLKMSLNRVDGNWGASPSLFLRFCCRILKQILCLS